MKTLDSPRLRFPGFHDTWQEIRFDDLVQKISESFNPATSSEEYKVIELESLSQGSGKLLKVFESSQQKSIKTKFQRNDVLYGKLRPYLRKFYHADFDGVCTSEIWVFRKKQLESKYLFQLVQSDRFSESADIQAGSKMPRSDWKTVAKTVFVVPTNNEEQKKIADFLSAVNEKIGALEKKLELSKKYKVGLLQTLFPRKGQTNPDLRFKKKDGSDFRDWRNSKLSDYLEVSRQKNRDGKYTKEDVLSVSGDYGVVNQIEFQGRSFAGASVAEYGVVETGDIVYTKSPLKLNPYGIIKANRGKSGIVSTLYAVYKCNKNIEADYLDYYFELNANTNRYLRPLVQKGAKNDMKISDSKFLIDPVPVPCIEEQTKITDFLNSIDQEIEKQQRKLEQAKRFKKALLQQMFI